MTKMISKTDIQKNEPQDYNPLNMVAEVGMMIEPTPRRGINKELQAVPIGEPVGGAEPDPSVIRLSEVIRPTLRFTGPMEMASLQGPPFSPNRLPA